MTDDDGPQEPATQSPPSDGGAAGDDNASATGQARERSQQSPDPLIEHILMELDQEMTERLHLGISRLAKMAEQAASAAFEGITPQIDQLNEALQRHFSAEASSNAFARFAEATERILPALERLAPALDELTELMPPNWRALDDHYTDLLRIADSEGIPVVWAPRAEILKELAAAPDEAARYAVLRHRSADIAQDCRELLDEVTEADFQDLVEQAREAVACLAEARFTAAQATATIVTDSLLHRLVVRQASFLQTPLEKMKFGPFRQDIAPADDGMAISAVQSGGVLLPLRRALESFDFPTVSSPRRPVPSHYNRHASVHQAGAVQYSPGSACVAVLLAACLLREAQDAGW